MLSAILGIIKHILKLFTTKRKTDSFALAIENLTGFTPKDISLYRRALTHRSVSGKSNERLEYLGDAALGLAVAEQLYELYPHQQEGFLTKNRSKLVCREHLNELTHKMKLDELLIHNLHGKQNTKDIYGNLFEAFVGALYLDHGIDAVRTFTKRWLLGNEKHLQHIIHSDKNFKSRLYEYSQSVHQPLRYELTRHSYNKEKDQHTYWYMVFLNEQCIGEGAGSNRREAQSVASRKACQKLNIA